MITFALIIEGVTDNRFVLIFFLFYEKPGTNALELCN